MFNAMCLISGGNMVAGLKMIQTNRGSVVEQDEGERCGIGWGEQGGKKKIRGRVRYFDPGVHRGRSVAQCARAIKVLKKGFHDFWLMFLVIFTQNDIFMPDCPYHRYLIKNRCYKRAASLLLTFSKLFVVQLSITRLPIWGSRFSGWQSMPNFPYTVSH